MAWSKKSRYDRQDSPPPMGDVIHVTRVGVSARPSAVIVSEKIWGTYTHFDGRTVRCLNKRGKCELCDRQVPRRWVGFIQWFDPTTGSLCALELTQKAGLQVQRLYEQFATLRGLRIEAARERATIKSPLVITFLGKYDGDVALPREKPIEPTLDRLWSFGRKAS